MSRIHEALKKAAQERVTQLDSALEAGVAEIAAAAEIRRPVITEVTVAPLAGHGRVTAGGSQSVSSQYEDLVRRCAHPEWRLDPFTSFFQNAETGSSGSERFRTLRSRLYQTATTRTLRRVLVTSSIAGEGKTFVAANLAQSIAQQSERRVLLIDADLRAPRLHLAFGAPNKPGLTEYLRGETDECKVIQKGMENLCLIPAGSQISKPSELLLSEKMKYLLNWLTPIFDWIIIDSPPALPVHDAIDLAGLSDGVLLVVRAGATPMAAAEKAAAEFKSKNLLGVVLNQVKKGDSYGEYDYSHRTDGV
jgi:capsular exopolysaccharide synthesis family protein